MFLILDSTLKRSSKPSASIVLAKAGDGETEFVTYETYSSRVFLLQSTPTLRLKQLDLQQQQQ